MADELNPHTFRWERLRDEDEIQVGLLWAGAASYPGRFHRHSFHEDVPEADKFLGKHPDFRMETRQCWVHFENGWVLSTIWGDATYSSNSWFASLHERLPFIEEPVMVEVGVCPPRDRLWGEPLGYVVTEMYHRVAELVMHLPRDIDLPEGEWDSAEGFCDLLITAGLDRTL